MAITLSANYQETLSPEIVQVVEKYVEDGYNIEDLLTTYDYFGIDDPNEFEQIVETIEDTGADNQELYDFIEQEGSANIEYFAKYYDLCSNYGEGPVNAFVYLYDVSDLDYFEEAYDGSYNDVEDFVANYLENYGVEIPSWVAVDYEATWESSLRFDYNEHDNYYFRSNW